MVGSADSKHPRLISYEIIFKEFQPNLCDHNISTSQTKWTTWRSNSVLCVASCSKN